MNGCSFSNLTKNTFVFYFSTKKKEWYGMRKKIYSS